MEMNIIEVALALVTIYLVMALAATQINELWAAWRNRRAKILTAVIDEVFRDRPALARDFFGYAPVRALSQDERKPGAIPPDLFATAFLAVLNDKQPPRAAFRTPSEFVAARAAQGRHLSEVLAAQVAGAEADWDLFEKRIARWFADICDRAEGWYKRDTARALLCISVLMTLVANVDSTFIARHLMENDELRVSLANISELIADQRADEGRGAAGQPPPPRDRLTPATADVAPFVVSADLDRALGALRAALNAAPDLAAFGDDKGTIARDCDGDRDTNHADLYDSNYEAWTHLIAAIIGKVEEASLGVKNGQSYAGEAQYRIQNVRHAMVCTTAIAKWVRAAQYATRNKDAGEQLKVATASLERAREHMQKLVASASIPLHLVAAYARLGQGFVECADEAAGSRAVFENCLSTAQKIVLPFGWPGQAGQFCQLSLPKPQAPLQAAPAPAVTRAGGGWDAWWGCQDFAENSALELPAIHANFAMAKLAAAVLGWTLTAVLVSLGAPFWYGLLGKVAQLRMAGRVRGLDDAAAERSQEGAVPGPPAATLATVTAATPTPFDSARNEFERGLAPKEISRLQIALDLPPTMQLDEVTRNAIAARLEALGQPPERVLTAATYFMVVGRNPLQAAVDAPSAALWSIGTRAPEAVRQLVGALNRLFAPGLPALPERDEFDHALRARVTLFRFKADPVAAPTGKQVVALASAPNGELLRLDDATRRTILAAAPPAPFPRDPAPWLDYAYGELGIAEYRAEGLTRIKDYLDSVGGVAARLDPAATSWCGAFVGWVLMQADRLDPSRPRPELLAAAGWARFDRAGKGKPGDICMVSEAGNIHHVAFLIGIDAEGRHWLLGGNQSGAVTLVAFKAQLAFTYVATENIPR